MSYQEDHPAKSSMSNKETAGQYSTLKPPKAGQRIRQAAQCEEPDKENGSLNKPLTIVKSYEKKKQLSSSKSCSNFQSSSSKKKLKRDTSNIPVCNIYLDGKPVIKDFD